MEMEKIENKQLINIYTQISEFLSFLKKEEEENKEN
jgi:hypothetical protein